MRVAFTTELRLYPGDGGWGYVVLPPDAAAQVKFFGVAAKGFGSVRVEVTIGKSRWKTSAFRDSKSGSYLLPIKATIRKAEKITFGDQPKIALEIL